MKNTRQVSTCPLPAANRSWIIINIINGSQGAKKMTPLWYIQIIEVIRLTVTTKRDWQSTTRKTTSGSSIMIIIIVCIIILLVCVSGYWRRHIYGSGNGTHQDCKFNDLAYRWISFQVKNVISKKKYYQIVINYFFFINYYHTKCKKTFSIF